VNAELNGPTKLTLGDAEIARIGLGTNRLTNTPANIAFVKEAVAAGIGMIDTAYTYTGGESEETIGAAALQIGLTDEEFDSLGRATYSLH